MPNLLTSCSSLELWQHLWSSFYTLNCDCELCNQATADWNNLIIRSESSDSWLVKLCAPYGLEEKSAALCEIGLTSLVWIPEPWYYIIGIMRFIKYDISEMHDPPLEPLRVVFEGHYLCVAQHRLGHHWRGNLALFHLFFVHHHSCWPGREAIQNRGQVTRSSQDRHHWLTPWSHPANQIKLLLVCVSLPVCENINVHVKRHHALNRTFSTCCKSDKGTQ